MFWSKTKQRRKETCMKQFTASTLGTMVTFQCRVLIWPIRTHFLLSLVELASLKGCGVKWSVNNLCSPSNYFTPSTLRASKTCLRSFFPTMLSPALLLNRATLPRPVNHMLLFLVSRTEHHSTPSVSFTTLTISVYTNFKFHFRLD